MLAGVKRGVTHAGYPQSLILGLPERHTITVFFFSHLDMSSRDIPIVPQVQG